MSVCLYPINVKTAEPIRPKFYVGPHVAPGKVYGQSDFKYVMLTDKQGEEGQPQQFLVQATSESSFFDYFVPKVSNS